MRARPVIFPCVQASAHLSAEALTTRPSRIFSALTWPLRSDIVIRSIVFCLIGAALAIVWSPMAPTRLFDFDAANFALALDNFQPLAHQPQPPGYPLYVALAKLIYGFVDDVTLTFLIAGVLGAAAAVLMVWLLAERMFGRMAGIFAGLLLMTNPILWQTGMSDQVRIYIAVISIAVALALFPGWEAPITPGRLAASCFLLGLLAGFRPEMLIYMAPLPAITALRGRMRLRDYLLSAFALCAGAAPWFAVLLSRSGGIQGFVWMMSAYSAQQAGGSSVLLGARWPAEWKMFSEALWWASLGIAAWIPALCCVRWGRIALDARAKGFFLLAWFLPPFLFSVAVHIAASGHSLGFIPVFCIAGGWVLSSVRATRSRRVMILLAIAALILNVVFFFKPYAKGVREASYKTVAAIGGINESILEKIDWISGQNPVLLVSDSQWLSWRILEYYYPKIPLIFLPNPAAAAAAPATVWLIRNKVRARDLDARSEIQLPGCGTIIWLIGDGPSRTSLLAVKDAEPARYFVTTPAKPGIHFHIGRYRLVTSSSEPCSSAR